MPPRSSTIPGESAFLPPVWFRAPQRRSLCSVRGAWAGARCNHYPQAQPLGHGLAKVALDPVVDSQPLVPEGHRPRGDSSRSSGYRAKWAATRNRKDLAAATGKRRPYQALGARYDAIATEGGADS